MSALSASPAARCGGWLGRRGAGRARKKNRPAEAGRCAVPEDGLSEIRAPRPRGGGEPGVSGGSQYLRTSGAGIGEAAGAGEYSGTMNRIQPSVE